jgi:adenylate cyclase
MGSWRSVGALAALGFSAALPASGVLDPWDRHWQDAQQRAMQAWQPPRDVSSIVIVALDDDSLRSLRQPRALMHPQLGVFLLAMASSGAAAVALDLVLPDRSYDDIVPGYDLALLQGLAAMKRAGALVLAQAVDGGGRARAIHAPFVSAAGPANIGLALLPLDDDGVVRSLDDRLGDGGARVPIFASVLAERLGTPAGRGRLDFSSRTAWRVVALNEVIDTHQRGDPAPLRALFHDRIVFLGSTEPFTDLHAVPADAEGRAGRVHGVFIHAHAFLDLRQGRLVQPVPTALATAMGLLCALTWFGAAGVVRALAVALVAAGAVGTAGVLAWRAGQAWPVAGLLAAALGCAAARLACETLVELRHRRRLRRAFAGYVSPDVMSELEAGRLQGLASRRCHLCVLFMDVRDFTTRSEHTPPEAVVGTLNELFTRATRVIHAHGGTVKEFMGDGVMAFFGAPRAVARPEQNGFAAACALIESLPQINAALAAAGHEHVAIGIGLASGEAVVGHIGALDRHTYGAVGDCVNLASRLEGLCKSLGYPLVMSAAVADGLDAGAHSVPLGEQAIKGHTPVQVHGWRPASQGGGSTIEQHRSSP